MSKRIFLGVGLFLLVLGGFYFKKTVECFGSTGALNLPQLSNVQRGVPINLPFKMLRIAAPGCFKGHSSTSYKNVSCGYRINTSQNWILGKLLIKKDNVTEYEVECQIPPLPSEIATSLQLEYYFEYSPWDNPPERQTGKLPIR